MVNFPENKPPVGKRPEKTYEAVTPGRYGTGVCAKHSQLALRKKISLIRREVKEIFIELFLRDMDVPCSSRLGHPGVLCENRVSNLMLGICGFFPKAKH